MKIIDNLAIKIADKVNAQNDEVMLLTQENDRLQREYDAIKLRIIDYQKRVSNYEITNSKLKMSVKSDGTEINRLNNNNKELQSRLTELAESGERQANTIQDYAEQIIELENEVKELSYKNVDHEFKRNKKSSEEIMKLKQVNENQLKFIEILQTIASAKSDKTQLKDVFSHNLSIYIKNNFKTIRQASTKLVIGRTTLSELRNGKIALSFDNLDILDSVMCEYFECSVYELVSVKMEGKK